jgi:AAA+ ATPase superfamily predicted ATPase
MKVKQRMKRFLEFLMGNRQTGHTSLLNKIGKEHDVYIIVHNMQIFDEFSPEVKDKLIPIDNISILQAAPNKPVLLDNKVLLDLLDDSIRNIEYKEDLIYHYKETINKIKDVIKENDHVLSTRGIK